MPWTKKERKEYNTLYYQQNKHKINQHQKEYNNENKDKIKTYQERNPDKLKIADWKRNGMKLKPNEDWESIYLFYITCEECEECGVKLTNGQKSNSRNLDHDHDTGFIRNVLCFGCNIRRG